MYVKLYLLKSQLWIFHHTKPHSVETFSENIWPKIKEKKWKLPKKDAINKVSASKKTQISYLPPPHTNDEKTKLKRHIDDAF